MWEEVELDNLITRLVDYRGKTPRKTEAGIKLITAKVIKDGRIIEDAEHEYIDPLDYDETMRRGIPQLNDIIITTEAPLGEVALIKSDEIIAIAQRVILFTPDAKKTVPQFLYYSFLTQLIQERLYAKGTGTTVVGISNPGLRSIKIPMPPLALQRQIAAVLGRYDTLLENYRGQVSALEGLAHELYHEWFVRGRCPGLKSDSMGELPMGWTRVKFTDVISVQSGGTPKTSEPNYWDGEVYWFSPGDVGTSYYVLTTDKTITEEGLANCNSKLYPVDTVVITARGTVGKCVMVGRPMAINQSNYALVGRSVSQYFTFFKTREMSEGLQKEANGAVFSTITTDNFERAEIVLPDTDSLAAFDKLVAPMFGAIKNCLEQSEILRATRDGLLPRMLSGQLLPSPSPAIIA